MSRFFVVFCCCLLFLSSWCVVPQEKLHGSASQQETVASGYIPFAEKIKKTDKVKETDLHWETNLILRCATASPDCIQFIPLFAESIATPFRDQVSVLLVSLTQNYFDTTIPQTLTWFSSDSFFSWGCSLLPARVLLDKQGKIVMKSCGSAYSLEDLQQKIQELENRT